MQLRFTCYKRQRTVLTLRPLTFSLNTRVLMYASVFGETLVKTQGLPHFFTHVYQFAMSGKNHIKKTLTILQDIILCTLYEMFFRYSTLIIYILYHFRIKSFEFAKQGLTFEIPRILCLSDCAIRVLDPKYDHYSPTCKSFYPRPKVVQGNIK